LSIRKEKDLKDAVVAEFKVLSRNLHGEANKIHDKFQDTRRTARGLKTNFLETRRSLTPWANLLKRNTRLALGLR
jgi:hypothetical protein